MLPALLLAVEDVGRLLLLPEELLLVEVALERLLEDARVVVKLLLAALFEKEELEKLYISLF